jgi:hypothetical protein
LEYFVVIVRNRIFNDFLKAAGGTPNAALALARSPSAEDLSSEWTRRWWSIVYTGKIISLIGSIDHITFRTILADWYADTFGNLEGEIQKRFVRSIGSKLATGLNLAPFFKLGVVRK